MLSSKEFLAQECDNIGKLLADALRFDYGPSGSENFYKQCLAHRDFLRRRLEKFKDTDTNQLVEWALHVSRLSELIAKFERSHIGEFSWAIGDAFKRHAEIICSEAPDPAAGPGQGGPGANPPPDDADEPPQEDISLIAKPFLFIIADGGMTAYSVKPEQPLFGVSRRRIFTITVPRSLRHHVLLHPILGHEIGHAAQHVTARKKFIEGELLPFLLAGSAMASKDELVKLGLTPDLSGWPDNDIGRLTKAWVTEIGCDLFGLVFMGPSFMGAAQALLGAIDPEGTIYGLKHPPNTWRFVALTRACAKLKWDVAPADASAELKNAYDQLKIGLSKYVATNASADKVFNDGVIETAVDKICAFFDAYKVDKPLRFKPLAKAADLDMLVAALCHARPPLGQHLGANDWKFVEMDYRHILQAGWLAQAAGFDKGIEIQEHKKFFYVNRLCEQAILQRQALAAIEENHERAKS